MNASDGLARLEAAIASDLARIAWPAAHWVKPRAGPDGAPMLDVLVIGAGQGGLTVAHQLRRERVHRVLVVDAEPPERRGPWRTYGRMHTLRSPKEVTGPDLDLPSLTLQSWFTAQHGAAAWRAMGKTPKGMWADYLAWLERVLDLPVEAPARATSVRPRDDHVAVALSGPGGERVVHARHVVLATGIESPGRWWMPPFVEALPADRRSHTGDAVDFAALRGRVVAVLGAGASAFDNAATALEAGAAEVHVFFRRPALQRVQPMKQISYTGFLRHLGDLPDAQRWRFMRHLLRLREAFPAETHERVARHPNAHLHPGAGWRDARMAGGRVEIDTQVGRVAADHVLCGTGFEVDMAHRPELAPFADRVATWADRHAPPPEERDARLGRYPYLGPSFELTARAPGDAARLSRLRLFTFAATMSFGPSGSSINALKFAAPRLVQGITRALFAEGAEEHLADLLAYDTPEF